MFNERVVGNRKLHPNVRLAAAGNYASDKAHANRIITSMGSRVTHLHVEADAQAWLEYANSTNHDWRVLAYINEKPSNLHVFDPVKDKDNTFRCYRTWSDLSDILAHVPQISEEHRAVIEGTIGVVGATDFITYTRIADKLPKRAEIIADPDSIDVPKGDPALSYLLSFLLVDICRKNHFEKFLGLFNKFTPEFQFLIFKQWCNTASTAFTSMEIYGHPDLQDWVSEAIRVKKS